MGTRNVRPGASVQVPSRPPASDVELVSRMAQGDEKALEEIYDRYAPALYGLLARLLPDSRDREEILQETFLTAWRRSATYDGRRGRLGSWLMAIAHNKAIDALRRRRPAGSLTARLQPTDSLPETLSSPELPGADPVSGLVQLLDTRESIQRALSRLRPEEQHVVILAYFHGFTHREIAARFSIPLGTVKSRMRSAVERLRALLEATGDLAGSADPNHQSKATGGREER